MDRRTFLLSLATTPWEACFRSNSIADFNSFKSAIKGSGLKIGVAVHSKQVITDVDYADLVLNNADILIPEWEMKWAAVELSQGIIALPGMSALVNFANKNKLLLKGHTLCWGNSIPSFMSANSPLVFRSGFLNYFNLIMDKFGSNFFSLDVVNEALDPKNSKFFGLRYNRFLRDFGLDYISKFFLLAADKCPGVNLCYNDYGFDYSDIVSLERRKGLLCLLGHLQDSFVPIKSIGIQGHLNVAKDFNEESFSRFLDKIIGMGLDFTISEFDVSDSSLTSGVEERQVIVADYARKYFDVVFSKKISEFCFWGLSSKYSWLTRSKKFGRLDGQPTTGLPFDEKFRTTPLYYEFVNSVVSSRC